MKIWKPQSVECESDNAKVADGGKNTDTTH